MIELKYICKAYKNKNNVLKNINITLPDNRMCLVVGPSGSEKQPF